MNASVYANLNCVSKLTEDIQTLLVKLFTNHEMRHHLRWKDNLSEQTIILDAVEPLGAYYSLNMVIGKNAIPELDNILKKISQNDSPFYTLASFIQTIRDTLLASLPIGSVSFLTIDIDRI